MPPPRESILTALADLLRTVPFVPVLRGEVLPERVPVGASSANAGAAERLPARTRAPRTRGMGPIPARMVAFSRRRGRPRRVAPRRETIDRRGGPT